MVQESGYYTCVYIYNNNHASNKGGAMYIDGSRNLPQPEAVELECSIQYLAAEKIFLYFINNTAETAGSSLYWNKCMSFSLLRVQDHLQAISNLQNTESDPSAISSDPIRVCRCIVRHHMPNCSSAFPPIVPTLERTSHCVWQWLEL